MKIRFFKPTKPKFKYQKERLYRLAIREAVGLLVLNGDFNTGQAARKHLMDKAKEYYHYRT